MSVLNCPVCQAAMREINKQGVLVDVCTQCRGVWLDRGELEKLSALMPEAFDGRREAMGAQPLNERRRDWDGDDDDDYDEDRRHRGSGEGRQRRSKLSRFMDFFD